MAKPKNKTEREVMKLSKQLPPLSKQFKKFAMDKLPKYYLEQRNRLYCLECGNKLINGSPQLNNHCDKCGNDLINAHYYDNGFTSNKKYFEIHIVKNDYQVVRIVLVQKVSKRTKKPKYKITEVMQHWVKEDGNYVILSLKVFGMSYQADAWVNSSKLEPRTVSANQSLRMDITGIIYPKRQKYLPKLIKYGWKNQPLGSSTFRIFNELLTEPKFEILLKNDQLNLFDECVNTGLIISYWDQIKIAVRHKYIVEQPGIWFDHITILEELGKDIRNPKYILPENLDEEHERYNKILNNRRRRTELAHQKEKMAKDNIEYVKDKGKFLNLVIKKGNIEVLPMQSVYEFYNNGNDFDHCVYSSKYYEKKGSLVMIAKVNGVDTETVELNLNTMQVAQSRGRNNKDTEYHQEIVNLINTEIHKAMMKI